jgi:3-hydroxyisobutyrate dehydrogenase-like beta-hydroxyacid dehydrogenase
VTEQHYTYRLPSESDKRRKARSFALAAADELAVPMPLASLIRDHFLSEVARGRGESDWAALARVSAESAGLSAAHPDGAATASAPGAG